MSTYNGEKYLQPQLDSILAQKGVRVSILVRDDGSTDNTLKILKQYKKQGKLNYYTGPNLGPAKSFMVLIHKAPESEYYALSDQDDVWDTDKLMQAVKLLNHANKEKPCLYCGVTREVDKNLQIKRSKTTKYSLEPGFLCGEPLSVSGCTMVFNKILKKLLEQHFPIAFEMHDSWIKKVCSAVAGDIVFDPTPHMMYRQHDKNVIGGRKGFIKAILRRIDMHKKMGRNFCKRRYLEILDAYRQYMPQENVDRCTLICSYDLSLKNKLKVLRCKEFWRGRLRYKIYIFLLIMLNRY